MVSRGASPPPARSGEEATSGQQTLPLLQSLLVESSAHPRVLSQGSRRLKAANVTIWRKLATKKVREIEIP